KTGVLGLTGWYVPSYCDLAVVMGRVASCCDAKVAVAWDVIWSHLEWRVGLVSGEGTTSDVGHLGMQASLADDDDPEALDMPDLCKRERVVP
ncbi:hypothetical protein BaRGS_00027556, partial [Batillaria attramentaria]